MARLVSFQGCKIRFQVHLKAGTAALHLYTVLHALKVRACISGGERPDCRCKSIYDPPLASALPSCHLHHSYRRILECLAKVLCRCDLLLAVSIPSDPCAACSRHFSFRAVIQVVRQRHPGESSLRELLG